MRATSFRVPLQRIAVVRAMTARSPGASRSLATATFRLLSKSTNTSVGHSRLRNSTRVTTSPGCESSSSSTWNDCPPR